jgi:U32 family peptidase
MKIAAPVSRLEETEMLLHFGADELYAGIGLPEWEKVFGKGMWINRRDPTAGNLCSLQDVQQMTRLAHEKDAAVHITFNSPIYPDGSVTPILRFCEKLITNAQIDGLIVSDINFLIALSKEKLPVRIHLSSLGACTNSESVDYFLSLGVNRIILPRHLTLSEMETIVKNKCAEIEFEVFALNDGCYFEEGFCQTSHALGPFCMTHWTATSFPGSKKQINEEELMRDMESFREFLWYQNNCGCSFQSEGLPNGPCSLCWFAQFRDWGVCAVKIVGREASFYRKMRSVQMVREVMNEVRRNSSGESIEAFAKRLRNTPQYCEKGHMCYFREY